MEEHKDTQPLTLDEEQARELRELLQQHPDERDALARIMHARLNHDTAELIEAVKDAPAHALEILLRSIAIMHRRAD